MPRVFQPNAPETKLSVRPEKKPGLFPRTLDAFLGSPQLVTFLESELDSAKQSGAPTEYVTSLETQIESVKIKNGYEISQDWANTIGWIPVLGDAFKDQLEFSKSTTALFRGLDEQGQPLDLKGRLSQASGHYFKSQGHRLMAGLDLVLIFGIPELAIASKAGKAGQAVSKGIKAAHLAKGVWEGYKTYKDAKEILEELKRLRQGGQIDAHTALVVAPHFLEASAGRMLRRGKMTEAIILKTVGEFLGKVPKDQAQEALDKALNVLSNQAEIPADLEQTAQDAFAFQQQVIDQSEPIELVKLRRQAT